MLLGSQFLSLAALIVVGVILADMIANASGTKAFFNGLGGLWGTSINGLLGKTSTTTS
jgi:uncharacterized protein YqgC (DUF456 family)